MKTIHNSYLFTEKDGEPEKIIHEVSSLPQDYPAFIVSSNLPFLEKTIHAFAMSKLSPQKTVLYKVNLDEKGYFAFLRPKDEKFAQLYDLYRNTHNESDRVKLLSDMLESFNECIAVFSSLPVKTVEVMMKKISDQEENQHPAMYIPLGFIFTTPPFKASEVLTAELDGGPYYKKMFDDFIIQSKEWLSSNNDMTMELFQLCSNTRPDPSDPRRTIAENVKITAGIENFYLAKARDNQDYLKRIKILAAVNAEISHIMLNMALRSGDVAATAAYMFLFTRSMAQFAANKAVDAGLRRHASQKEGGEKTLDRSGLLALIRKYHFRNPQSTDKKLWEAIKNDLKKKNARPRKGYSVQFYDEPTDSGDTAGELIQKNPEGLTLSIKFETFTEYRKEARK
jgi:hypothetical protein